MKFFELISIVAGTRRRTFRQNQCPLVLRGRFRAASGKKSIILKPYRTHRLVLLGLFGIHRYIPRPGVAVKFKSLFFLLSMALLACSAMAKSPAKNQLAQNTLAPNITKAPVLNSQIEPTSIRNFSFAASVDYTQKIAVDQVGEREASTSAIFAPAYRLSDIFSVRARLLAYRELSGVQNSVLENTSVRVGLLGSKFSDQVESFYSLGVTLPTNELTRKQDSYQGGLGASAGLMYSGTYFRLTYSLGLTRNFHEFDLNAEGSPNVAYVLANSLELVVPVTDKLNFSSSLSNRTGRTYRGFERNSFLASLDLSYDLSRTLAFNLGTSNEGNSFKSNGVTSNIAAYNDNSSVVRAGLTYTY